MNPPSITPLEPQSATQYAAKGYLVLTKKHGKTFITTKTQWPKKKKNGKLELPQFDDIVLPEYVSYLENTKKKKRRTL